MERSILGPDGHVLKTEPRPGAAGSSATLPRPTMLELTEGQLHLVEAGLKLLLAAEDDHETIAELKQVLAKVRLLEAEREG